MVTFRRLFAFVAPPEETVGIDTHAHAREPRLRRPTRIDARIRVKDDGGFDGRDGAIGDGDVESGDAG